MLIRSRTLTGLLFITLAGTSAAGAAPLASSTHQTEQDKARQEALAPQQQDFQSSQQRVAPQGIPFPEETHCKLINRVDIDSDNQALTRKLLAKTARQAQGRCLGSEGIRLLAYTLQNELIAQGYITSLIDVPSQSLEHGILRFTLHYGKVGAIDYADGSDTTRLWNSLPTSSGTILRLSDLEQGMANLQRLPGATAHMKLLPGQHEGESDIQIARSLAKKWQLGAWLDDAGSKASGRYQAGGALYLYDLTTLNDILYLSGGGDIEFNQHNDGNHNGSLYYSIPFGYWTLSAYGAYSQYRQQFNGNWSTMDYKSKNRYYSATLSRLLSHTRQQKTAADLRIAKSTSHYYFGGSELLVMRKQNPSWEFTLNHQHYFNKKIVDASIGIQRSLPWLSSTATPEEQAGLYSPLSRIVHGNLQAMMKFDATGDKFTWAPRLSAQFSPDKLASDNKFNIGSRWSVRGFDGENSLSGNQGWYWRNDFIWDLATHERQFYLGADIGRLIGADLYQKGKVLSGAVSGLRGQLWSTQYDLFISTPLSKPDKFHSDALNMGFSLQWRY
ncbi:TPA: ShlB/FhaC/HecB family hemolysin secretion/activation protein [Klebsiella pneumoniae]|nr:ShlB/FhaC/HecB family hemolysin secretion/activation protein [Klebsiella pneumoniae]